MRASSLNKEKFLIYIYIFFFIFSKRFINARRRIVQPMIDQSNRAGKLYMNDNEPLLVSSPTVTKRNKHSNKSRGLSLNNEKLYRRINSGQIPIVSQQLSPSYLMKGKSVKRSNIIYIYI